MQKNIIFGNKIIGENQAVFIIAELSGNHNQSLEIAKETIKAIKRAGADAVKLQTYTPDTITIDSKKEDFLHKGGLWDGQYLYELYKKAYTPWGWHKELFELAAQEDLICFSTPFDKTAVDFLDKLENPIYKVASFEITDIPLIRYIAEKQKPVIISTGIAYQEDIKLAVDTCRSVGNNDIILLKCTSAYPSPLEEANLSMIPDLSSRFDVISGLSDHTLGIVVPLMSVAYNCRVIEKHFILNKKIGGPDAAFSLDENEFSEMVLQIRNAEKAIGKVDYALTEKQLESRKFSRSLYAVDDIASGDLLTEHNVRSIRPGYGLHPRHLDDIIGKKANKEISKGTPISWELIS